MSVIMREMLNESSKILMRGILSAPICEKAFWNVWLEFWLKNGKISYLHLIKRSRLASVTVADSMLIWRIAADL